MDIDYKEENNEPSLCWELWDDMIFPQLDKSTSLLQSILKYRQISQQYRNEIIKHIRSKINDPTITSPFDELFLTYIIFGTLEEVQNFVKKHQLTVEYMKILRPIKVHHQQQRKGSYNCDLIRWLIDLGLDVSGVIVSDWHIWTLPFEWNMYLLNHGATCKIEDPIVCKSAAQFSQYWKYVDNKDPKLIEKLVSDFFYRSQNLEIRIEERKEFIMSEYRSTSSNNLFKTLPLETVQQIVSYQLDDYLWIELSDIMIRDAPPKSLDIKFGWYSQAFAAAVPTFIWKFMDKFSDQTMQKIAYEVKNVLLHTADDEFYDSLLIFFRLPIMANTFPKPQGSVAPTILAGALKSRHPKALDLIKVIAETQSYNIGDYRCSTTALVPEVWLTLERDDSKKVIEFLILEIDAWPMENKHHQFYSWVDQFPQRFSPEIVRFTLECLKKKEQRQSNNIVS